MAEIRPQRRSRRGFGVLKWIVAHSDKAGTHHIDRICVTVNVAVVNMTPATSSTTGTATARRLCEVQAERVFGTAIVNSDGKQVPTRILGEQHVWEDCGRIPTLADWLRAIRGEKWMFSRSNAAPDRVTDEPAKTHNIRVQPVEVSDREDWPHSVPTHGTETASGHTAPTASGDRLQSLRR